MRTSASRDQRGLAAVVARHDHAASGARRVQHRRQHAMHGAQFARKRELAEEFVLRERIARNAAVRGEDAERDRQIEAAAVLGQVGRREIDRDLALRIVELRVEDRGAHAIARFLDRGFGQTDDRSAGQPAGQMHFTGDQRRSHAVLRAAVHDGETHDAPAELGRSRPLSAGTPTAASRETASQARLVDLSTVLRCLECDLTFGPPRSPIRLVRWRCG